jgi:hypothetical protein
MNLGQPWIFASQTNSRASQLQMYSKQHFIQGHSTLSCTSYSIRGCYLFLNFGAAIGCQGCENAGIHRHVMRNEALWQHMP